MNSPRYAAVALLVVCCISSVMAAWASESVTTGIVIAVEASADPRSGFGSNHAATAVSTTIGGALGYQAAGNRNAAAAGALGAAMGAYVGSQIDTRRRGRLTHTVVVQLDRGGMVGITDPRPAVRVGDRVYVIGGNRVIHAYATALPAGTRVSR